MENQMEKKMENEMEAEFSGAYGFSLLRIEMD